MDAWYHLSALHTFGFWVGIFLLLLVVNTWMRNNVHPPLTSGTIPERRADSTITAATALQTDDDSGRPDVVTVTILQFIFLISCHLMLGGYVSGLVAEDVFPHRSVHATEIIYWALSFTPPLRLIPTGIALCWLLAVAYASYTNRLIVLATLTVRHWRLLSMISIVIILPIAVPLIVIFSSGFTLPSGLDPLVLVLMFLPGVSVLVMWLAGRGYRKIFRSYAGLADLPQNPHPRTGTWQQ